MSIFTDNPPGTSTSQRNIATSQLVTGKTVNEKSEQFDIVRLSMTLESVGSSRLRDEEVDLVEVGLS